MTFRFLDNEKALFETLGAVADSMNILAFVVGGFVRDRLIDRETQDIDIVCVGDGIKYAEEVSQALGLSGKVVVFQRFGTAMLKYGSHEIEFVGARKESYSQDSRKPSVSPGTIEDDQNRRDFTINALAVSINSASYGELVDPFGGLSHLEAGVIRTPMDPDLTFSDDPLRMIRAVRFATQLGFHIHDETLAGIKRNKERFQIVSAERIITELNKIVLAPKPSTGLDLLSRVGLLNYILPEFENLRGVSRINGNGHKDNYYHTLKVLDNLSAETDDLWLRWSAILHDIAKPHTKKYTEDHGWTFHGHEVVGARLVPKLFKRLRLPLDSKMKYVQKLVRLHLRPISLTNENITDSAVRRLLFDAGDDIDDLMMLCRADITSKNESKVTRILNNYELVKEKLAEVEENDKIRNWQPPITGEMIMQRFDLKPSRVVGDIKNSIREAILDGVIPNEQDAAYSYMIEEGKKLGLQPVDIG